ncbi:hypothetical protein GCM10027517_38640 [Phycicoccus ginsengisoli]
MTTPRSAHVSSRPEPATHARRPVHRPVGRVPDRDAGERPEGLVARLEGIRDRLRALLPIVHDEGGRQVAAALREVDALLADLHPRAAPAPQSPAPAPGSRTVTQPPPDPATGSPARAARRRPPALPCGPDYPLVPVNRER